jgi:hypothetical protein
MRTIIAAFLLATYSCPFVVRAADEQELPPTAKAALQELEATTTKAKGVAVEKLKQALDVKKQK